jgi:AcrR family transcriptional regulator
MIARDDHKRDQSVRPGGLLAVKNSMITVRHASGDVEHRYEVAVPKVGDRLGNNDTAGFVTSVQRDGPSHATVFVGTPAPPGVSWNDLVSPEQQEGERATTPRERILEAAYELFSKRGIRAVGTDEILEKADVARATLYRHFGSKEELVLAFLQRREQRWTREFVEAEARRRGSTSRARLLAIFDIFDEWFHRDDFEGCSFINTLLETADRSLPVGKASAAHLEYIRSIVCTLAEQAGVPDGRSFARSWHILMKGSIVAAGEGDVLAAQRARAMAEDLLDKHLADRVRREERTPETSNS